MKHIITKKILPYIIGIIFFFLLWLILSLIIGEKTLIFPSPIDTIKYTFSILKEKYIYKCIFNSLIRMFIGYTISLLIGFIFGLIAGIFPIMQKIFKPTIIALKAIPTAALVFLFLVLGKGAKIAPIYVIVLISFPIIYDSIVGGINNISPSLIDNYNLDGGNKIKNIIGVKLPLATSYLLVGIASSFALSFKIEVMAEVIAGDTSAGIGAAIRQATINDPSNMIPIFAYSLIAIIIVLLITFISLIIKKKVETK